jgi:tubulin-specific chaperone E
MTTKGTRLSISSFLCTVLYIGPVKDTSGTWLGVEWDDPSRGKHSGTHNGVQYFSTRYFPLSPRPQWGHPNSRLRLMFSSTESRVPDAGSFIRPGKKTDGERTLVDGVRGKYVSNAEYERVVLEDSGKEIEMIGFDKIEQQQRYVFLRHRSG